MSSWNVTSARKSNTRFESTIAVSVGDETRLYRLEKNTSRTVAHQCCILLKIVMLVARIS